MPILNTSTPIYYTAYGYTSGLLDVSMMVLRPDQTTEGPFILNELAVGTDFYGIYVYNYTFTQIGTYVFTINSVTVSSKNTQVIEILQKSPFMERI